MKSIMEKRNIAMALKIDKELVKADFTLSQNALFIAIFRKTGLMDHHYQKIAQSSNIL